MAQTRLPELPGAALQGTPAARSGAPQPGKMATWVIGDVQGCFGALTRLLRSIDFQPGQDQVWLAGDLVNRGPDSLGVLRWAAAHPSAVRAVLGNHDLHLLSRAAGVSGPKRRDTLDPVLVARDRERLLGWLAEQPLLVRDELNNTPVALLHAGLLPNWSLDAAATAASECSALLQGSDRDAFLSALVGVDPSSTLREQAEFAAMITRLRCVDRDGLALAEYSGSPEDAPDGSYPWFDAPSRQSADTLLLAGHWAAAGLRLLPNAILTDSGCVWGQQLSAVRLADRHVVQVPAGLGIAG